MLIEKLDRCWMSTPVFRHKMTITSQQQIAQLKACGVQTVVVRLENKDVEAASVLGPDIADGLVEPAPKEEAPSVPEVVPFEEELPVAREVYQAAKTVIQSAMNDTRLGRAINVDSVREVVSDMADSVFRNPDALPSLSRLKRVDEYTFFHSVNTSLLPCRWDRALGSIEPPST